MKNYRRFYSHLKIKLQAGRAISDRRTQFDETKSRTILSRRFFRGGFAVSVGDKIRPIVFPPGESRDFPKSIFARPLLRLRSGSDLHTTIPDQSVRIRILSGKRACENSVGSAVAGIFAFAMLSTSRDDAFSNNLRQYNAFWFVKDCRKPGDREDGKASEGQLYPFRNALITYLRNTEIVHGVYLPESVLEICYSRSPLNARSECTLRHV